MVSWGGGLHLGMQRNVSVGLNTIFTLFMSTLTFCSWGTLALSSKNVPHPEPRGMLKTAALVGENRNWMQCNSKFLAPSSSDGKGGGRETWWICFSATQPPGGRQFKMGIRRHNCYDPYADTNESLLLCSLGLIEEHNEKQLCHSFATQYNCWAAGRSGVGGNEAFL